MQLPYFFRRGKRNKAAALETNSGRKISGDGDGLEGERAGETSVVLQAVVEQDGQIQGLTAFELFSGVSSSREVLATVLSVDNSVDI